MYYENMTVKEILMKLKELHKDAYKVFLGNTKTAEDKFVNICMAMCSVLAVVALIALVAWVLAINPVVSAIAMAIFGVPLVTSFIMSIDIMIIGMLTQGKDEWIDRCVEFHCAIMENTIVKIFHIKH